MLLQFVQMPVWQKLSLVVRKLHNAKTGLEDNFISNGKDCPR